MPSLLRTMPLSSRQISRRILNRAPSSREYQRCFSWGASLAQKLTHLTPSNTVRMVTLPPPYPPKEVEAQDASPADPPKSKPATSRIATAVARLRFSNPETVNLLRKAALKKGDALAVARIAGIMGSKMTSTLIPLCHNIPLSGVDVDVELHQASEVDKDDNGFMQITATARTFGQTGVEMEALTAVSVASLSAYDMCKAVDKGMSIDGIKVVRKEGGRSGSWLDQQWAQHSTSSSLPEETV